NTGTHVLDVYLDPTPPIPVLDAGYHDVISGIRDFTATTDDEDVDSMRLEYWSGSGSSHDQGPGGNVTQGQVGPSGTPPQGGVDNMFCAPTAAANGLMRAGQRDPRILNGTDNKGNSWNDYIQKNIDDYIGKYPDDPNDDMDEHDEVRSFYENQTKLHGPYVAGGALTNLGLAMVLACKMHTDIDNGTAMGNVPAGLLEFLNEQNITANYTISEWNLTGAMGSTHASGSAWRNYTEEIRENETVIITIYFSSGGVTDVHTLTGQDFNGSNPKSISVTDPRGGDMDLPYKEDGQGNGVVNYKGKWYYITNITSVSPTDATRSEYYVGQFLPTNAQHVDSDGSNGWSVPWDTTTVADGFYLVRATMTDAEGNLGSGTVEVIVDNKAPIVEIGQPLNGSFLGFAPIEIIATETSGSEDIDVFSFLYSQDNSTWFLIGNDTFGSDGWSASWDVTPLADGLYFVKASTTDYAGNEGSDTHLVIVDTLPPVTTLTIGTPKVGTDPVYVSATTDFNLTATDVGGVQSSGWSVSNATYDSGWILYIGDFTIGGLPIGDGPYDLTYGSTDLAGNSDTDTQAIVLDTTPPDTTATIGDPKYGTGPVRVNYTTEFNMTATDASGVQSIDWHLWNSNGTYDSGWQQYTANFTLAILPLGDGNYNLTYRSTDVLSNVEMPKDTWIYVDLLAPVPLIINP
ncbi:MAG: hypothetical protein KAI64_06140, partial [Thermoplasmata archaeon]|nr:hypothetical protein [Thermoplasmata archaeon]